MPYASKELIERAAAYTEWNLGISGGEVGGMPPESYTGIIRDLAKATELPTDADYVDYEVAIEAWLEEALSTEGEEEGCYIVTGDEINAICNLALRAPRPEPKPEPRASSDMVERAIKDGRLPYACCEGSNPNCYGPCGCLLMSEESRGTEPAPEPRPSSALLAESKKAVEWLRRTRHPDALRFLDPLLAAIEAEEARGPSEVEKTDIMQQRGCLNHVGDPDHTCRICYLTMSDIAEELRDERDEAIKRADGLRSDVDYWQNIVTASVKACGYPGLLHSELFSHVEQLRKERDEAIDRTAAALALSTPPQPNHASGDRRLTAFLREYGSYKPGTLVRLDEAAIAELCRRALGGR